ncbi:hypothetical protein PQX77_017477, partial [Marasmius sp. AFHP31]
MGLLRALVPPYAHQHKNKDHGHDKREQSQQLVHPEEQGELTRLIGFLTATSSEDWALILDVCERATASDSNAKEAIRALCREFKYGQPQAQLGAGKLWAIMLRNSSDTFVGRSTSPRFLATLEELLLGDRTDPAVRERVLGVLATATYASRSKKDTGLRDLWKKVKLDDMPDEGMSFDHDDGMFKWPLLTSQRSHVGSRLYEEPQLHPNLLHTVTGQRQQQPTQTNQNQPSDSRHGKTGNLPPKEDGDATKERSKNSLSSIDDSLRPSRYRQERETSDARYTLPLSSDNSHLEHEEGEVQEEEDLLPYSD